MTARPFILPRNRPSVRNRECGQSRDRGERDDRCARLSHALYGDRVRDLARRGFRYADTGGRPMTNLVFSHGHGRLRVERDRVAGLKVYDDREAL